MNIFDSQRGPMSYVVSKAVYLLILCLILWAAGAPTFKLSARAAAFTNFSDTLSDSDLGVTSAHTIRFTTQTLLNDAGA